MWCGPEECPGVSEAKVVGIFGNDDVEVGHLKPTRTIFSVIQTITDGSIDPTWPADGLLGMQRPNGFETSPSSIQGLAKAAGSAEVTLAGTDNAIGTLTLGGKDTVNCDANWNEFKVPTGDKGDHWENWHLRAQKIAFGTAVSDTNNFVLFVHINTIYVPSDAFAKITTALGASKDATTGSYIVDCTKLSTFPDLVLTFSAGSQGVYEYHIPAVDYVSM
ncbi:pepsin A-like protein, partial [Aphelenchoides avenae]